MPRPNDGLTGRRARWALAIVVALLALVALGWLVGALRSVPEHRPSHYVEVQRLDPRPEGIANLSEAERARLHPDVLAAMLRLSGSEREVVALPPEEWREARLFVEARAAEPREGRFVVGLPEGAFELAFYAMTL